MQELLQQTIRTGLDTNTIKPTQVQRVNIDTTVQEKHIRLPNKAATLVPANTNAR